MNMKKAEELFSHIGIQPPKSATILCFDDSITYTDENVKRFSDISSQNAPAAVAEPEKPISKERRAEMLAAFSAKYSLDGLDVFVRKDKAYAGDGRAYDLLIKNGRSTEFQARVFTLEQGARFTEAVLESALVNLEWSAEFQQFISFRQGQHTLFDQPEEEKVDTSSNSESEESMDAETIALRQREIDKAIQTMQRRLESSELTLEKRQELEDNIAFLQSADAEHIEITQEAMDAFRAKRAQEREAQLDADVEREWEEAAEREVSANLEAADALNHHRDVYLDDTRESDNALNGYITNARKQDFYNYRLHFDAEQGYLLMADDDREDDLIIRNFGMADSSAVLRAVREMGFEVESVEPAFTYELYQMKSGNEHRYHRFETLGANRYAHLTQDDYDLVYSGDLREVAGETVQQKLDMLFETFNLNHPADYSGRSMSTSDVIVVTEGSGRTPYYVQPVGFEVMPDFFAHKADLIDIKFTGNPQGFNAIKVAARTDSFDDTGETNMLIADTPVFYARLSENAALADVQKVIQTAYENDCYLTADSVAYLTERFGVDFMPELPPVDTVIKIPEADQIVDLAAAKSFTLTDSYSQYEGGMDSDGHERRDNYSGHSRTLTFTYRGFGIVESEMWSDSSDYPVTESYNLYSPAQRDRLLADMQRFADRAEDLTVSTDTNVQSEWSYYIVADMKTWSLNESPRSKLEHFDTLEEAIARFKELRTEAYNDEAVYTDVNPNLPLARLTLGISHSSHRMECDLIQVRGGQIMLVTDYTRYNQSRNNLELQTAISTIAEQCGIDSVLDIQPDENGKYVYVTAPYEQPQTKDAPERNFVLVLNDNDRAIQLGEVYDSLESAQDAGNDAIHGGQAIGYAVLNRQEQKVEVYDSDFPTSGVFSEEVYANSSFQTLTVHTDAPLPALHEEPAEPESTIEFGLLGNGITVYDTARTQPHSSDYLTVAHISEEGNVQYYAEVSDSDRERIETEASRQLAKFTEQWNAKPDTEKLLTIMQTANPSQVAQIMGDKLPADQLLAKYAKSVIFHTEEFPTNGQQPVKVAEPLTVESLKQRYLHADTHRQLDSYEIAGMVLIDSEGMAMGAAAFFDRFHASRYSEAQAAEIRGYLDEALKNSPQETLSEQTADTEVTEREWTPIAETENDEGVPTVYATEMMNGDRYFITTNPEGTFDIEIRGSKIDDQTGYSSRRAAENGFEEYISDKLFDRAVNLINDFCVAEYSKEADFSDLSHVDIAHTTDEDTDAEIQAYADLQNFRIVTQYAGVDAGIVQYDSLEDMVEHGLEDMSFEDLVYLTDEQRTYFQAKMDFQNADLAGFLADRTLSSDEKEDMAYPLYDRGYLDKHQPSEKAAFGYHLSETALYDLARRFHSGDDIRRELALALLDNNASARIDFVFEDGKISGRTYYHPESERHTLETVRTDTGFNCYFNGTERTVSCEEIGQAFLDHIHEESNDLARWWVRAHLHEAFPEMTDEQMRDLITAFDGARMADWEKGDNSPKINHIKRALYEILGDEEQTEKAFAIIAEGKYHVNLTSDAQNANQQIDEQPPQIADGKPLSNLITFVRDENRRVLDELAVGDSIGLPNGNYTVTAIDGDFKIDLRSDETGNTGSRIGNWKEMLLNEAGNAPISVVKASVVQQLADAAAAKMPETSIAPEVDTNVNPEHSAPELAVGDHLIFKGKEYEVESLDMDSFITLKDTALENAPRLVSRVNFVAQEFINSSDFQKVEPQATADAKPETVDTNVKSETDTAEQPVPDEPAKRRGRLTRPEELYKLLSEMYPQIISGEHSHEHYESETDNGYEPLSIEMIGDDLYSFMTYYIQNGDLMRDPDITFMLDHEEKTCHVFSFQQDGVPPQGTYYVEVADENGRVDTKLQASLEQTFLQNLKNAQFADRTLTRYHDRLGEEIVLVPDKDEIQDVVEPEEPVRTDENAHLRGILNDFSEEHGLGALDLRFTGSREVGIFETYADGSDKQLGEQPYWGDNDQISPTECTEILQRFVETERRRGHRVEDANGRKYAVSARGKSELPPVPDDLPEIVYSKAPLDKVRDNIAAIRELHRLARCEANGEPLYDKKRNQWNCKENSDDRLRKYSGWGGLSQVFDAKSGRYAKLRAELQKLLTPEEYASAKASATDAHYTPQTIIDAMWSAVQNMGIPRDSRVLEPACGTGNFITRMPHSIGNAGVVGVELDAITAQITARLNADNPNVTIMHSAFERSGQEDSSFDLAIGNVPFGDYKMNDPDHMQDWLIHDAFFRKALDKVAAGGVVAFVTSTGTLDKKNPKVREYLATHADLIGAIRLPNTAFLADAGTGVPTDIIFLQKRAEPLSPDAPKPDWCYVTPISQDEPDIRINSYFVQNPQMMLGTMRKTSFQDRLTCDPIEGVDLKKQLDTAIRQLNAKITVTKREKAAQERRGYIQPWGKQFTYQEKEGKIYYNEGKTMRQITGSAAEIDRLKRLIELRMLTRQLIDKQKTAVEDFALIPLREQLNRQYDEFVRKYGQLNSDAVKKAFNDDADYALLQSLEEYDSESKTYAKAEIFNKRTVNPVMEITAVETLEEAYQVSLDQRGKPNIPYMATLLQAQYPDTPFTALTKQVQAELLEKGMVFIDPEKEIAGEEFSGIVERAEYLSGNVRRKLAYAQEIAKDNPDFQRNVEALKEVIPEDIHAEEIAVRLGCPWIDPVDYTKFLQELSGRQSWDTRCEVKYSPVTGEFDIMQAGSRKDLNVNEGTTYGTDRLTMYEIAQKLLNQRRIAVMMTVPSPKDPSKTVTRTDPVETKKALEKARIIEEKFAEWIFADPARKAKYERRYNDLFNSLVGRKYDGSHLTFEGQSAAFTLRPHQRDCVARAVYGGNTLAAHVVGAGKSAVFQTAVMKKKQLGLINKACVVVPKPLVEQTAREWRKLYPDARLLTMTAADLSSEAKRDLFAARVATGDYDAVIVSMEQFEKMPMSLEFQKAYLQRQLDDLEDMLREQRNANGNRKDATTKQIEGAKKKLKNRLDAIMNPKSKQKGKDILLDFEQLGFDYLVVDEAHNCTTRS
ncbi:MAG: YodL domain-containing protein [Clostridia bacterium]|nr:YodL domain-containing protein [Clostridia bacterium]